MTLNQQLAVVLLTALLPLAHAPKFSVTWTANQERSQREVSVATNKWNYLLVEVQSAKWINKHGHRMLNLHVHPFGTNPVFDRDIAFCGDKVANQFGNKGTFVVLTYDREMHEDGCYDLFSVHEAKEFD